MGGRSSAQAEPVADLGAVGDDQAGEDDGDHVHQFDEDVQGRSGGVLEGVADGVPDDGGLVGIGAFAAVLAGFDEFLGVVPGAAGVGHEDGDGVAGAQAADEQTEHATDIEEQAAHGQTPPPQTQAEEKKTETPAAPPAAPPPASTSASAPPPAAALDNKAG